MLDQRLKTRVENFVSRLERENVCMHGSILSVKGEIKATAYYAPFEEGQPHRMYSVSKSMTALAIGILLDEGKLKLDDHIADYFPDYLPEYAQEAAGPYFFSEPNQLGLKSVELRGNELLWENAWDKNPLRFGLGENIVDIFPGWPDHPTLSSGGWIAPGILRVRCWIIGDAPCGVDMLLHFGKGCLTVQSRKSSDPATNAYEGVASRYQQ